MPVGYVQSVTKKMFGQAPQASFFKYHTPHANRFLEASAKKLNVKKNEQIVSFFVILQLQLRFIFTGCSVCPISACKGTNLYGSCNIMTP